MSNDLLKTIVVVVFFVTGCNSDSHAESPSAVSSPDVNDVFKIGDFRDISVKIPKERFAGAPHSPRAYISRNRIPSSEDDYLHKYVRITIIEKIQSEDVTRIVFQLDEIDANGVLTRYYGRGEAGFHKPLYYAYLDVGSNTCLMKGSIRPIHEYKSNVSPGKLASVGLERGISHGIPFPLMFTCPPVVTRYKSFKDNSCMGVVFTEAAKLAEPNYMRIKASLVREVTPDMQVRKESIRYYSTDEKIINAQEQSGTIPVLITGNETQIWDKPDDWLWLESERTNEDGNVTLYCRKLEMDKDIQNSSSSIYPMLFELRSGTKWKTKEQNIEKLAQKGEAVVPILIRCLKHELPEELSERIREELSKSIIETDEGKMLLRKREGNSSSWGVQQCSKVTLVRIGSPAVPMLIESINKQPETVAMVVTILGEIGDQRAIPALISVLGNNHYNCWERAQAAESLEKLKAQQAIGHLIDALEGEGVPDDKYNNEKFLNYIADSLAKLSGESFGFMYIPENDTMGKSVIPAHYVFTGTDEQKRETIKKWRQWWQENKQRYSSASIDSIDERMGTSSPVNLPVNADSVDDVLNRLQSATGSLKSYQSQIEYKFSQPLLESETLRKGVLYYQKSDGKSALRINFQTLKQDEEQEQKYIEQYIFDGVWLTLIDYQIKEVKRYQKTELNEPVDAFELVSENFPIIGFGKVEDLKKEFEIGLIEQQQGGKAKDFIQLHLRVKSDSIYKNDYTSIDFWIDKELHLPAKIVAVSTEGDIYEIEFLRPRINEKIDKKVFEFEVPEGFTIEITPLKEKSK